MEVVVGSIRGANGKLLHSKGGQDDSSGRYLEGGAALPESCAVGIELNFV